MKKKTKQPRQKCMYCDRDYANNDTLAQHILKVHPDKVDHTIEDEEKNLTTVIVKEEPNDILITTQEATKRMNELNKAINQNKPTEQDTEDAFKPFSEGIDNVNEESDTMVPNEIEEPLEDTTIDFLQTTEIESKLKEINDEILSYPDTPTWFVDLQIFANKFKKTGRVIHEELTFVTKMYTMLTSKPPLSTSCSKTVIQMALVIATNFFEKQLPPFQKQLDRIKELEEERDNIINQ